MAGRDAERKAKCDECGEIHSGIDCVQLVFILRDLNPQPAVPKAATLHTIYYYYFVTLEPGSFLHAKLS